MRTSRIVVIATVLLTVSGAVATTATAASAATAAAVKTIHYLEVPTSVTYIPLGGKPVRNPANVQPRSGDKIELTGNLFSGSHVSHSKNPVGTDHTLCTFTKKLTTVCEAQAALGGSMVIVTSNGGDGDGDFDSVVTNGTGRFLGVTGKVHTHPLANGDADLTLRLRVS
jgi:hypothetical protein